MNPPLVTVGIPFFDAKKWLLDAIRSVFAQSFDDWEILLVDDGSTDGSADIALAVEDPRVRVYLGRENLKVAARRNEVVQRACGKYLAWLDADDMMHPHRLEKEVRFLEENPGVDVVGSGMFIIDEQGSVVGKRLPREDANLSSIPSSIPLMQGTVMGKIEWFRSNPYDERFDRAEDPELWLRTLAQLNFTNLPELLYFCAEFESFSLQKYRLSCQSQRKAIRRHGPALIGTFNTHVEVLKAFLKTPIYAAAFYCGLHRLLLRRRSLPLTPEEKSAGEAVLERIRRQKVPLRTGSGAFQN